MQRGVLCLLALAATVSGSNVCVNQACAPQNVIADYVFLIDSSNAFEDYQFQAIKDWLRAWTKTLTISPAAAQVALYTYGQKATSSGSLTSLSTVTALNSAIDALQRQDTNERNLGAVLTLEESEVNAASGLRANAEKMLVVFAGDAWTGNDIFNPTLDAARAKFDAILVIGVGVQPIDNAFQEFRKLAGVDAYMFWAYDLSLQLPYAGLWLTANGCPNAHADATTVAPTTMPTPPASAGCSLQNLDLDLYLVVDTSSSMPAADFADLKKYLYDFVAVFPLGAGQTQIGLVTTYADSQLFYTGIGSGNINRRGILHTIEQLQQEIADGQTLKLSLQAIESAYLKTSTAKNKLMVYFTGNTNWDVDPTDYLNSLNTQYIMKSSAVRWTTTADASKLATLIGGLRCLSDGSTASTRADAIALLEQRICLNSYCR